MALKSPTVSRCHCPTNPGRMFLVVENRGENSLWSRDHASLFPGGQGEPSHLHLVPSPTCPITVQLELRGVETLLLNAGRGAPLPCCRSHALSPTVAIPAVRIGSPYYTPDDQATQSFQSLASYTFLLFISGASSSAHPASF